MTDKYNDVYSDVTYPGSHHVYICIKLLLPCCLILAQGPGLNLSMTEPFLFVFARVLDWSDAGVRAVIGRTAVYNTWHEPAGASLARHITEIGNTQHTAGSSPTHDRCDGCFPSNGDEVSQRLVILFYIITSKNFACFEYFLWYPIQN